MAHVSHLKGGRVRSSWSSGQTRPNWLQTSCNLSFIYTWLAYQNTRRERTNARFSISNLLQTYLYFSILPSTWHCTFLPYPMRERMRLSALHLYLGQLWALNASSVLVEIFKRYLNSNLRRRKVPWNNIFYTRTFAMVTSHVGAFSSSQRWTFLHAQWADTWNKIYICVFQYCDNSHI